MDAEKKREEEEKEEEEEEKEKKRKRKRKGKGERKRKKSTRTSGCRVTERRFGSVWDARGCELRRQRREKLVAEWGEQGALEGEAPVVGEDRNGVATGEPSVNRASS